ncbi:MAG TPA: c(7)-type cytochrome triheme domain-containing protein [Anaeromyxobacter sp.]
MNRRLPGAALALAFAFSAFAAGEPGGMKKRRPLPHEYGRVVIDNGSTAAKLPPVVFEHWAHRGKFTCRLCHVDIGFGMSPGSTRIKAADNMAGYYCGACHDRKRKFDGGTVFEACQKMPAGFPPRDTCYRCHSYGKDVKPMDDFASVTRNLPRGRFGNGVDWEKAEQDGLIKPVDFLEGISIKRQSFTAQKDFALSPKVESMPEIVFSHAKHTVWNGCELCHPEIFVGVKKGTTKYTMVDIFEGKYCGVCHVNVAFPMTDCQRCHVKAVR